MTQRSKGQAFYNGFIRHHSDCYCMLKWIWVIILVSFLVTQLCELKSICTKLNKSTFDYNIYSEMTSKYHDLDNTKSAAGTWF